MFSVRTGPCMTLKLLVYTRTDLNSRRFPSLLRPLPRRLLQVLSVFLQLISMNSPLLSKRRVERACKIST